MGRKSKAKQARRKADPDNVIKFQLSEKRDEEIERHNSLVKSRIVFEAWKKSLIGTRLREDELPGQLNILAAALEREVSHPDIRKTVVELAEHAIGRLAAEKVMEQGTVLAAWDCPRKIKIQNIESDCGGGGIARFIRSTWEQGSAEMRCPKCGGNLAQKDMIEADKLTALRDAAIKEKEAAQGPSKPLFEMIENP